jgi:hypothetical protein
MTNARIRPDVTCQHVVVATLLPADFDLASLEKSEQRVVASLLDHLGEGWYVVPHVPITVDGKDTEIDVVIVHPARGVVLLEVKGGKVGLRGGQWYQYDHPIGSPVEQVKRAKHALVQRMRSCGLDTHGLFMCHAVALPDVGEVPPEGLGPDCPAEIAWCAADLAYPDLATARLLHEHGPIPAERTARFLAALRPDVVLEGHEGHVLQLARKQLDDETRLHLSTAAALDANERVLVTGGAGTGKTRLVVTWARRAAKRGERTLVACFNRPIAEALRNDLEGTGAMVGTFHDLSVRLLEPHGFRVGEHPTAEYWRDALTTAMEFHAEAIGTPFDTVVVDEAQDFHPHWLAALQALLDPSGPHRMLLAADPAQALYVKDWTAPAGVVVAELQYNLRNCEGVAKLVQRLGGPKPLPGAPYGDRVTHGFAGGPKEVRKRVRDALRRLLDDHNVPMSQIAVLTTRTDMRDMLRAEPPEGVPLCSWEERSEDAVLCETVHRAKGLERTAVVLVDMTGQPDPVVLYVGASRAVASLTVVGPNSVAEFLAIR